MDVDGWEDDGWMDDGQLDRWMKGLFLRGHAHFQTTERNLGVRGRVVGDGGRMQPGAVDRKKSTSKRLESTREESPDLLGVTDALELTCVELILAGEMRASQFCGNMSELTKSLPEPPHSAFRP